MFRALILALCLMLGVCPVLADGVSAPIAIAPIGASGAAVKFPPVSGASYTGIGDITFSTGSAKAYWSTRCYSTSYTGNVADIYAPADASHTLLTCSSGGVLNQTLQALSVTCAVSCTVKTLYDQSGAGSCGGVCDLVQATIADRPAYIQSCSGGRGCMRFAGSAGQALTSANSITTLAQPFTISAVAGKRTATGAFASMLSDPFGGLGLLFNPSANSVTVYAGGVATVTASDSAYHSHQAVFNGSSSSDLVDTTTNTGLASGTNTFSGLLFQAGNFNGNVLTGDILELVVFAGGFSGTDQNAAEANQHSANGFNF